MASELNKNYAVILNNLKEKIRKARLQASFTVNTQLLQLYWEIGNTILLQQQQEGWGTKVIGRLAVDLKMEFPDMKGLSQRNMEYMLTFATAWPYFPFTQAPLAQLSASSIPQPLVAEIQKVKKRKEILQPLVAKLSNPAITQPLVAQLPWTHHTIILDKVKGLDERRFYIRKAIQNGWSKSILTLQIENKLHKRQGKAITNFDNTLPPLQSDLAKETLKNPYLFDFLSVGEEMQEREHSSNAADSIKILPINRNLSHSIAISHSAIHTCAI